MWGTSQHDPKTCGDGGRAMPVKHVCSQEPGPWSSMPQRGCHGCGLISWAGRAPQGAQNHEYMREGKKGYQKGAFWKIILRSTRSPATHFRYKLYLHVLFLHSPEQWSICQYWQPHEFKMMSQLPLTSKSRDFEGKNCFGKFFKLCVSAFSYLASGFCFVKYMFSNFSPKFWVLENSFLLFPSFFSLLFFPLPPFLLPSLLAFPPAFLFHR